VAASYPSAGPLLEGSRLFLILIIYRLCIDYLGDTQGRYSNNTKCYRRSVLWELNRMRSRARSRTRFNRRFFSYNMGLSISVDFSTLNVIVYEESSSVEWVGRVYFG
jgi:hypothetical protein